MTLDPARACRVLLGTYVAWHFAMLVPSAPELFSNVGAIAEGTASPLLRAFPNALAWFDAPWVATWFAAVGAVAGVFFAVGRAERVAAALAWYVLACFFGRNPLILNPSMPFVGFLLLAHAVLPSSERQTPAFARVLWVLMALGYTYSGVTKLVSPSWIDGSAVTFILENPLARPSALRELVLDLPEGILRIITWATLLLEVSFLPLSAWKRARPFLWVGMVSLHGALLVLIDFADLTLGMLVLHAYTFDPR